MVVPSCVPQSLSAMKHELSTDMAQLQLPARSVREVHLQRALNVTEGCKNGDDLTEADGRDSD